MSRQFWAYTEARRHRFVISSFGDIQLPSPWSLSQAGFFVASFIFMILTRGWWGPLIGFRLPIMQIVAAVAIPVLATYALNLIDDDDRNPLYVIVAWFRLRFVVPPRVQSIRLNRRCRQRVKFRP